ncbi:MAG TPA: KUP/HAK/KT family potassium transporter [Chitinophagales bacterium]|nr:MAG: potassium transporter Kup [Bacteroidia bacterium]HMV14619.1 KUP/HAK/KT family potassium transporter [Chitinophagales bacterium]HMW12068.1 KUP/HAK/KT family potassium transporter [Chitinophagales bacterium]HMX59457.1 KUP/HAK/KT family potassium transporter [Chitinophagales bacterium]HMY22464.1 KUP/HAK/KT family potassium transporter [Chitinophagales bacterium]
MAEKQIHGLHKLSAAGVLISLGIIFGDIGTSPIYVLKAVMNMATGGNHKITEDLVLGAVSCVFWTLTIVVTIKYVILALNADNKGEGGIFALYAIVRRYKAKWTIIPALIGCASLMADGFITPPISISSAVEGLTILYPGIQTVPIVITILAGIFLAQQFGTNRIGSLFGPIMFVWFSMIGTLGFFQIIQNPSVIKALNPMYAINLVLNYPGGFWFLGAVFLCSTGGEALYSDLGHCGKQNIRVSWTFVKIALVLSYLGQAAFIINHKDFDYENIAPFYAVMPEWFLKIGIVIATMATIIASQALITGCFTLINEAMKLKLWPNQKIIYPSIVQGQIYFPFINWMLFLGCVAVVLIFRESGKMEAAYGLAISLNMIMTTSLLVYYMYVKRKPKYFIYGFIAVYVWIEFTYLVANLSKFSHGGWFAVLIAVVIFVLMYLYNEGKKLRKKHIEFVEIKDFLDDITDLQNDTTIPKEATNLVFMCNANDKKHIDSNIIYSIFRKKPKRADTYWLVHVDITNEPYGASYSVDTIIPKKCFFIRLKFGFKVEHKVHVMFTKIVEDMESRGEIDLMSHYPSLRKHGYPADFKYVIMNPLVSIDNKLNPFEQFLIKSYNWFKSISLSTQEDFGLEKTNCRVENVPIRIAQKTHIEIRRED